jgi:hypothetical protein
MFVCNSFNRYNNSCDSNNSSSSTPKTYGGKKRRHSDTKSKVSRIATDISLSLKADSTVKLKNRRRREIEQSQADNDNSRKNNDNILNNSSDDEDEHNNVLTSPEKRRKALEKLKRHFLAVDQAELLVETIVDEPIDDAKQLSTPSTTSSLKTPSMQSGEQLDTPKTAEFWRPNENSQSQHYLFQSSPIRKLELFDDTNKLAEKKSSSSVKIKRKTVAYSKKRL